MSISSFTASPRSSRASTRRSSILPRLYTDDRFRERVVAHVTDPETLRFWHEEFPSYTKSLRSEAIAPILNKAGQIAASPHLRLILGQVAPRLDLAFTMNNRRILIANLAKGTIGEQAANLLGLASRLAPAARRDGARRASAARARAVLRARRRIPDVQLGRVRVAALGGAQIRDRISASRTNTPTSSRTPCASAVIGNAGTLVVFRVGSRDAELLAPEFRPMDPGGLADQEPFTAWLRRGIGRDRIFAEPQLYEPLGTAEADPRAEPAALRPTRAARSSGNVESDSRCSNLAAQFQISNIVRMLLLSNIARHKNSRQHPVNAQSHHATHSLKVKSPSCISASPNARQRVDRDDHTLAVSAATAPKAHSVSDYHSALALNRPSC